MKKSNFLKIGINDLLKGFLVAVITVVLTGIYQGLEAETFAFNWSFFKPILLSGLGAGIAYILKNWVTNSQGQILKKES